MFNLDIYTSLTEISKEKEEGLLSFSQLSITVFIILYFYRLMFVFLKGTVLEPHFILLLFYIAY